jgi:hypothetical protein
VKTAGSPPEPTHPANDSPKLTPPASPPTPVLRARRSDGRAVISGVAPIGDGGLHPPYRAPADPANFVSCLVPLQSRRGESQVVSPDMHGR